MNDSAKYTQMHDKLDGSIEQMIEAIDNAGTGFTPAPFAGVCTAKVLLAHAQYTELGDERAGGWQLFRQRLQTAVQAVTRSYDSGQPTQFGLWDGLHFAAVEAGKIDGEQVAMNGETVAQEAQDSGA
jgi:hypothetical protein